MLTITDIFAGAGGSTSGAVMIPGVEVRVAANHWQMAVDVHQINHPGTDHACVDLHLEDPRNFPRTDILWASPECFTAGHLVTTARGQVPIEDVEVGDMALTHLGRWRKVVRTQNRRRPTVIVKGQGHTGIETTATHRFWLRSSRQVWQGRPDQYRRVYEAPCWAPIKGAVLAQALWATPVRVDPLPISAPPAIFGEGDAAWWLAGRWVGDGSLTFGRNHEVSICCGDHEADLLRKALSATGALWVERQLRTATLFTASDLAARDWLYEHFGHGAHDKGLPSFVFGMPAEHQQALLDGYLSADGSLSKQGTQLSTVSRRLAISVRMLAEGLGHRVTMSHDKRLTYSIEGRTGVARLQWSLQWTHAAHPRRSPTAFAEDLHAWSRVRSIRPGQDEATVYNIEVEEDHSYVLDGIVVANCTKWSQARGKSAALSAELGGDATLFDEVPDELISTETDEITRSRLLMFDVLRFVEHHRYRAVVVENVVDIATQPKYSGAWKLWLAGLRRLGYSLRVVSHNAMHAQAFGAPAPQSRDRLYVVAWREGERAPDIDAVMRPSAWCTRCDSVVESVQAWKRGRTVGKYRVQYVYACSRCGATVTPGWLPAAAAIDWSLPGQRIGDRTKPLADKTRARIAAGIARYWRPFHLEAAGNQYDAADPNHLNYGDPNAYYRTWSTDEPLKTLHTIESKALAIPLRTHGVATTVGDPLKTFVAGNVGQALVTEHRFEYRTRPVDQALPTVTASGNHLGLVTPFIAELRGGGSDARSTDSPLATVSAQGNHHALVSPYYGTADTARSVDDPLGTLTTRDRYALITRHFSSKGDGAEMTTPVAEYLRTLTTTAQQSVVTSGDVEAARAQVDDCLFRMLEPHEVAAGMAFPLDYQWLGTRRDRVKLAGNAVCPPAARDLIGAVVASLEGVA